MLCQLSSLPVEEFAELDEDSGDGVVALRPRSRLVVSRSGRVEYPEKLFDRWFLLCMDEGIAENPGIPIAATIPVFFGVEED